MPATNLAATTTRPGTPLLQAVRINTEPRGDFARFFLRAEQLLHEAGISMQVAAPETLVDVNEANRDSWPPLFAAVDYRKTPVKDDDEMHVFVGRDRRGAAVATVAVRRFDYSRTTVADELTSLRMIFGAEAEAMKATRAFELTAPTASKIRGQVLYSGAVWVHPTCRKLGLTRILSKLARYFALARKPFDFEIAMSSAAILKPHIASGYAVERSEPAYAYKENGKTIYEGVFNWSSRDWVLSTLRGDVEEFEALTNLGEVGRDQQKAAATG